MNDYVSKFALAAEYTTGIILKEVPMSGENDKV